MLKEKISLIMAAVMLGCCLTGCCDGSAEPYYPLVVSVSEVEGYEITKTIEGAMLKTESNCFLPINAGFYNDDISDKVLKIDKMEDLSFGIGLRDGDFASDTYEGVNIDQVSEEINNGNGKFYAVLNDPSLDNYYSEYETVKVEFKTSNSIKDVAFHKKTAE